MNWRDEVKEVDLLPLPLSRMECPNNTTNLFNYMYSVNSDITVYHYKLYKYKLLLKFVENKRSLKGPRRRGLESPNKTQRPPCVWISVKRKENTRR